MKTVVIAGASGVVGSRVVTHLLARTDVTRIVALGRRALSEAHPKLVSRVVDLQNRDAIAAEVPERAGAAFCCLGTTLRQAGSKPAFAPSTSMPCSPSPRPCTHDTWGAWWSSARSAPARARAISI